jgi:hypothetical protein
VAPGAITAPSVFASIGQMSRDDPRPARHHMRAMRIDRGYLFWGIFFVLLGAIPLADREGWIEVGGLRDVWRWWPLFLIGIGVIILFSRSRLALVATVVAAVALGTLAGTALSSVGGEVFDCVRTGDVAGLQRTSMSGTLTPDGEVQLRLDCGDLTVGTAPGTAWSLDAGHAGDPPRVAASADTLQIRPADGTPRRQQWAVTLPSSMGSLRVDTNASSTVVDVSGATLAQLRGTVNAGDLRVTAPTGPLRSLEIEANAGDVNVVAPTTAIGRLDVQANAASIELRLSSVADGSIDGTAMSVRVCLPTGVAVVIRGSDDLGFSGDSQATGVTRSGDRWMRQGTTPGVTLAVGGTASSFTLLDEGACT